MPLPSDSNFRSVMRTRRPLANPGRPPAIAAVLAHDWGKEELPNDDVDVSRHEALVAPLLEEGELDSDSMVVSPTGNSSATAVGARERRRREEGWNDMGLDQLDGGNVTQFLASSVVNRDQGTNTGNTA